MGGIPFMAPPVGFPPMGFNGPRFWSYEEACTWKFCSTYFPSVLLCCSKRKDEHFSIYVLRSIFLSFVPSWQLMSLRIVWMVIFLWFFSLSLSFLSLSVLFHYVYVYVDQNDWKNSRYIRHVLIFLPYSRLLTCDEWCARATIDSTSGRSFRQRRVTVAKATEISFVWLNICCACIVGLI